MYTPNNQTIYIAVFSAAMSGMAAAGRVNTDSNPAAYADPAAVAGAFAQEFDTEWGARLTTDLDLKMATQESYGLWEGRLGPADATALNPATYLETVTALIAMIDAGGTYMAGQGVVPVPVGSQIQDVYYRPGAPSVFPFLETWTEIQQVINTANTPLTVYIDKSALPLFTDCHIPAASGVTDCRYNVTIKEAPKDNILNGFLTYLFVENGATVKSLYGLEGVILSSMRTAGGPPALDFDYAVSTAILKMSNGGVLRGGDIADPAMCDIPDFAFVAIEMSGDRAQIFGGPTAGSGHAPVFSIGLNAGLVFVALGGSTITDDCAVAPGFAFLQLVYDRNYRSQAAFQGEPTFPLFAGFPGLYFVQGPAINIVGGGTVVVGPTSYTLHSGEAVLVDCSAGNVDLFLPGAGSAAQVIVKAVALSGAFTITVHPPAFGGTVEGGLTDVIAPVASLISRTYSEISFDFLNGPGWFVTSQYG